MKKLILSFTIIATLLSCQEKERTTFEINGTIENPGKETSLALISLENDNKDTIAVSNIENGTFKFTGSVEIPVTAATFYEKGKGGWFRFILENDVFTVTSNAEGSTVEGGKIQRIVSGYKKDPAYQKARKEYLEVMKSNADIDRMDEEAVKKAGAIANEKNKVVSKIKNDYDHKILEGDYPVMAKLYLLPKNYDWARYDYDARIAMYDEYDKALSGNEYAKKKRQICIDMKEDEEKRKSIAPGQPFKNVVAHTLEGTELKLSDVVSKNKYTLLEFWASWCGPCRAEFPHLKKAYAKYNSKGFEIYGLSLDENKDRWVKAMNEENVPWINVVDYKAFEGKAAKDYVINGIPASFLIDQNGKIVTSMSDVRGFALDRKLEELFGE